MRVASPCSLAPALNAQCTMRQIAFAVATIVLIGTLIAMGVLFKQVGALSFAIGGGGVALFAVATLARVLTKAPIPLPLLTLSQLESLRASFTKEEWCELSQEQVVALKPKGKEEVAKAEAHKEWAHILPQLKGDIDVSDLSDIQHCSSEQLLRVDWSKISQKQFDSVHHKFPLRKLENGTLTLLHNKGYLAEKMYMHLSREQQEMLARPFWDKINVQHPNPVEHVQELFSLIENQACGFCYCVMQWMPFEKLEYLRKGFVGEWWCLWKMVKIEDLKRLDFTSTEAFKGLFRRPATYSGKDADFVQQALQAFPPEKIQSMAVHFERMHYDFLRDKQIQAIDFKHIQSPSFKMNEYAGNKGPAIKEFLMRLKGLGKFEEFLLAVNEKMKENAKSLLESSKQ